MLAGSGGRLWGKPKYRDIHIQNIFLKYLCLYIYIFIFFYFILYIYACVYIGLVPVAQWLSIALAEQKVVGSVPREHTY